MSSIEWQVLNLITVSLMACALGMALGYCWAQDKADKSA